MLSHLSTFRAALVRRYLVAIKLVLGILACWLLGSYAVAYRLTRRASPLSPEQIPAALSGQVEAIRLTTLDHQNIGAWFLRGDPQKPVVILLHGNGGRRSVCLPEGQLLCNKGISVLLVTLRAHGDSSGDTNDFGYSARNDVFAAVDWLGERRPNQPIVVWGKSLGSAAALFAGPLLEKHVAGYILECPYQDIDTATHNRLKAYLPHVIAEVAFFGLKIVRPLVLPVDNTRSPFEAASRIPTSAPILLLAGSADTRARPSEARQIYNRVASHARLVVIPDGKHLQLRQAAPEQYDEAIFTLIEKVRATYPQQPRASTVDGTH